MQGVDPLSDRGKLKQCLPVLSLIIQQKQKKNTTETKNSNKQKRKKNTTAITKQKQNTKRKASQIAKYGIVETIRTSMNVSRI